MKKSSSLFHSNQHGMTLVEVMVAGGLVAGLAVAGMTMFKTQTTAQKTVEQNYEVMTVVSQIRTFLSNPDNCRESLPVNANGGSVDFLRLYPWSSSTQSRFVKDTPLPGNVVIRSFNTDTSVPGLIAGQQTALKIVFSRGNNTLKDSIQRNIVISYTGGSPIATCFAAQNQLDSFWIKSLTDSSEIYYMMGNVGIGTANPDSKFHVVGPGTSLVNVTASGLNGTTGNVVDINAPTMDNLGSDPVLFNISTTYAGAPRGYLFRASDGQNTFRLRTAGSMIGTAAAGRFAEISAGSYTVPPTDFSVYSGGEAAILAVGATIGTWWDGHVPLIGTSHHLNIAGWGGGSPGQRNVIGSQVKITANNPSAASVGYYADVTGAGTNWAFYGKGNSYFSGNVGVGTSSSGTNKLTVQGSAAPLTSAQIRVQDDSGVGMLLGRTSTYGFVQTHSNHPLSLNPVGNFVGIGNVSPRAPLDVSGEIVSTRLTVSSDSTSTSPTWSMDNAADRFRIFRQPNILLAGTEHFTITNNGNVGIGISSPSAALQVVDATTAASPGNEEAGIHLTKHHNVADTGLKQGIRSNLFLSSNQQNAAGMLSLVINNGTTNLGTAYFGRVDAAGGSLTNAIGFHAHDGTGAGTIGTQFGLLIEPLAKAGNNFAIYTSGATKSFFGGNVGFGIDAPTTKIDVIGTVKATSFVYSSDKRLKKDIFDINDPLKKILGLRGVNFNWKSDGKKDIGFIAQEVEKVEPRLVFTDKSGMKSVKYGNIVAIVIEAIKELNQKLLKLVVGYDELKQENEMLKQRLDQQEAKTQALLRQQEVIMSEIMANKKKK